MGDGPEQGYPFLFAGLGWGFLCVTVCVLTQAYLTRALSDCDCM